MKKNIWSQINQFSCYLTFIGLFPSTTYHRASLTYIHQHTWLQFSPIALPLTDWLRTWRNQGMHFSKTSSLLILFYVKIPPILQNSIIPCVFNFQNTMQKCIQIFSCLKVLYHQFLKGLLIKRKILMKIILVKVQKKL